MRRSPIALALIVLSVTPGKADDVGRGHELAQRLCSGCHSLSGHDGREYQGAYVRSFPDIAAGYGRSVARLKDSIAFPHRPMPGFPLSSSEIDDLATYIHSLNPIGR